MKESRFEDMDVWQDSMKLCEKIYEVSKQNGFSGGYGLRDQIRRSSLSIPSNIAEGFERDNDNEFVRFLKIAKGSAGELRTQLNLAKRVGSISESTANNLFENVEEISKQIYGLIEYIANEDW